MSFINRKALVLLSLAVFLIGVLIIAVLFLEPTSAPQNVFISNITDSQATVSWTTEKPTRGIVVAKRGAIPSFIQRFKNSYKDDGESSLSKSGFYTTHHVTITNLKPEMSYVFIVYQGWRRVYKGKFTTGLVLKSLSYPKPVYGKVVKADGVTPVVGVLVYFRVKDSSASSSLLSTLTNKDGRWSINLGNLRTKDMAELYAVSPESKQQIIVDTGRSRGRASTTFGQDAPWPNIVVGSK